MYNQLYGSDNMQWLIVFIAYVVFFFSFYKIMYWFKGRNKKNDLYNISEIYFFEHKLKVDVKKIGLEKMLNIVALSNSILFTLVLIATSFIDNFVIRLVAMFFLLMPLTFLMYFGISRMLNKKGKK